MVLRRRTEESSKLETLGLLTRLLPDSAYLTDLTIDRDKAVLTGFARDTAHIVAALEGTAKLQDVRLTGTTTRDGPDHREAFQISARMHTPQQAGDER